MNLTKDLLLIFDLDQSNCCIFLLCFWGGRVAMETALMSTWTPKYNTTHLFIRQEDRRIASFSL